MAKYIKPEMLNTIWASTGDVAEPDVNGEFTGVGVTVDITEGWTQIKPPYQVENWIQNQQSQFNAYINQLGIPEWDAETEYQTGKSFTQGSDGRIYKCIQTHTGRNPVLGNPSYWETFEGNRQATSTERGTVEFATIDEARTGEGGKAMSATVFQSTQALESARGTVFLANTSEVNAGNNAQKVVTPATLSSRTATGSRTGVIALANNAETNSGINDEKAITPAKLRLGVSMNLTGDHRHVALPSWLGGVIINWGTTTGAVTAGGTASVTYSKSFSNTTYGLSTSAVDGASDGSDQLQPYTSSRTASGAVLGTFRFAGSSSGDTIYINYLAIGT